MPQSPFNQSTNVPDEEANNVLPAVPIEANKAYCVAVYVLSTKDEMNPTNATVANAAARSSKRTAAANKISELPTQANTENIRLVSAMIIPDTNIALSSPIRIEKNPPSSVNDTVVIHPIPLE